MVKKIFSVIIPVYNAENYLEICLNAVIQQIQCDKEVEIIIVDDGSTDSSAEICDIYRNTYPDIIKVFHNENCGLLYARRFGYSKASGNYIVNCDSDDMLVEDFFRTIKIIVDAEEPDVIIYNMDSFDGEKTIGHTRDIFPCNPDEWTHVDKDKVYREFIRDKRIVSLCTKVFKKSCIDCDNFYLSYGKFNNGEDTLQSIEIYSNASSFVYFNKALYVYRTQKGMTARFDENYYERFTQIFTLIIENRDIWLLKDFDNEIAYKIYWTLGRSITQLRYAKGLSLERKYLYLKKLRRNELVQTYRVYFGLVSEYLMPKYYGYLIHALFCGHYLQIIIMLELKNIVVRLDNL